MGRARVRRLVVGGAQVLMQREDVRNPDGARARQTFGCWRGPGAHVLTICTDIITLLFDY